MLPKCLNETESKFEIPKDPPGILVSKHGSIENIVSKLLLLFTGKNSS